MPSIDTLAWDIEALLRTQVPIMAPSVEEQAQIAHRMLKAIAPRPPTPGFVREERVLWPREVGNPCMRAVWYALHFPSAASLPNAADAMKFAYGHLLEEVLLAYAEMAGHTVEKRQLKLTEEMLSSDGVSWRIRGKIDAVIDGVVVDVKSCSRSVFKDLSSYYPQVDWYAKVGKYDRSGILAVDKSSGRIRYEDVPKCHSRDSQSLHGDTLDELDSSTPPARAHIPSFNSNGHGLPDACLFCPFKYACWPGLRAFKYAYGPVFFTEVEKAPRVPEMTRTEVESAPLRG